MSDESALLSAILAHPNEDTPRLVYADWLDEHDFPDSLGRAGSGSRAERAEFIRLQCSPASSDGERREAELEERSRRKWLSGLPQFPGVRWEFRRGFPEYLDAEGHLFLEWYPAFVRVPWLRFLSLHDLHNSTVRDFVNREWAPQWVDLELQENPLAPAYMSGYDCTPAIVAVARCPQVRQLRSLRLSLFEIGPAAVHELATSRHLERLEHLLLDDPGDSRFDPLRERFGDRLVIG